MASRSLKPSYLASAAAAQGPSRSPRPSFTRTNSSSSARSDDSFVAQLKEIGVLDKNYKSLNAGTGKQRDDGNGTATRVDSTNDSTPTAPPTPGRKRSRPIAIEVPAARVTSRIYTPLSARGSPREGYFDTKELRQYHSHPFSRGAAEDPTPTPAAFDFGDLSSLPNHTITMSVTSPFSSSPSDASPRSMGNPKAPVIGLGSPVIPDVLAIPMGKYHPSNYRSPATTTAGTPTSTPRHNPLPPTNLELPTGRPKRSKNIRPGHARQDSDVQRALLEYQRTMMAQAQLGSTSTTAGNAKLGSTEPISPKLLPAGSPGPITPFELEGEDGGYIVAGNRSRPRGNSLIGNGLEKEREMRALKAQAKLMKDAERSPRSRA